MVQPQVSTIGIRLVEAGDHLMAPNLVAAWDNLLSLLSEIDRALSLASSTTMDWSVNRLSRSSPAELVLEPIARDEQLDNRSEVIQTTMTGIVALEEHDERPAHFTDRALESARGLVSVVGPRIRTVELFTPTDTIVCSGAIASNVNAILRPGQEMIGSIEGHLEALNSHGKFEFALYEPVRGLRIPCELDTDVESDLKDRIVELYEERVRVSGRLRTNRLGEVRSARVREVSVLRSEPRLKSVADIAGIYDITGGRDVEEYLRSLRDA